jgi:hypothetical protein
MNAPLVAPKNWQDLEAEIEEHVKGLKKLHARLDPGQVSRNNYSLALQQIDALGDFVWGGLDPFIRFLAPLVVPSAQALDSEQMEEFLEIACDEYTIKGHKKLLRRCLDAEGRVIAGGLEAAELESAACVSAQELADDVYAPKSDDGNDADVDAPKKDKNEAYRKRLVEDVMFRMRDIGVWTVPPVTLKKSKRGGQYHPGYSICAGPVLMAFNTHLWVPYQERYHALACRLHQADRRRTG